MGIPVMGMGIPGMGISKTQNHFGNGNSQNSNIILRMEMHSQNDFEFWEFPFSK